LSKRRDFGILPRGYVKGSLPPEYFTTDGNKFEEVRIRSFHCLDADMSSDERDQG
jgi:hypothetical protein